MGTKGPPRPSSPRHSQEMGKRRGLGWYWSARILEPLSDWSGGAEILTLLKKITGIARQAQKLAFNDDPVLRTDPDLASGKIRYGTGSRPNFDPDPGKNDPDPAK